ncbi:perilipin-2-like isoform X2 [Solea solea]|uniref:perilipin-2-like isoform X2 n=1 Tax=Solea solea TaxID=90069 RepID=UPI00272D3E30|nr:perilipin-2-like isoform X2 [Solea solea]
MTNKHEAPNAAARLSQLPVVRSACSKLSHIYTDTKHSHPTLRTMCETLESSVTALSTVASDRVSPVIVKLQPQISAANDVVCKSLDWLEITFPVLHTPAEEIVATAKNKVHEIQDVVSLVANGTKDCVTWAMERMQHAGDGMNNTLAERAITVASMGLDSALNTAEALVDQVLPPTEEEKKDEEEAAAAGHLVQGFEGVALRRSYGVRLASLTAALCRRTYHVVGVKVLFVQVCCGAPSDHVAEPGVEPAGGASVPAVSGCVHVFLFLSDLQIKLPTT